MLGETRRTSKIPLDLSKIKRCSGLTEIVLKLTERDTDEADVIVELRNSRGSELYSIRHYSSRKQVERQFPVILGRFNQGKYRINVYDNGHVDIKLL